MNDIFSGIRIIDLTKVFSGPFSTRLFADYGAEVIKVESKELPDDSSEYPPLRNCHSGYYEMLNRNKKGIALNLKSPNDLNKFYELCKTADVIVENLTPQTKYKLKINYQTICTYKKDIIYASLSGLGQDTNRKYYDILAQAESGLMSLSGTPQTPMKIGPSVVDAFTGLMFAFGVAGALLHKSKTGQGQYLDVSMLGCAMQLLESNLTEASITNSNPKRTANQDNLISPFGVFKTQDGYIALAAGNNTQWAKLAMFIRKTEDFDDALFTTNAKRLENSTRLTTLIEKSFTHYASSDLISTLQLEGIGCTVVNEMLDILKNASLFQTGDLLRINHPELGECVTPGRNIRFSAIKQHKNTNAPQIGENDKEYGI